MCVSVCVFVIKVAKSHVFHCFRQLDLNLTSTEAVFRLKNWIMMGFFFFLFFRVLFSCIFCLGWGVQCLIFIFTPETDLKKSSRNSPENEMQLTSFKKKKLNLIWVVLYFSLIMTMTSNTVLCWLQRMRAKSSGLYFGSSAKYETTETVDFCIF